MAKIAVPTTAPIANPSSNTGSTPVPPRPSDKPYITFGIGTPSQCGRDVGHLSETATAHCVKLP